MSKAPYLHSDGSDCYTKDCSRGHVSVHAPVKSFFAQALAAKSLTRPVEVEEVTYDEYGFAPDGFDREGFAPVTYIKDHLEPVENPHGVLSFRRDEENEDFEDDLRPEVHSYLIANGFTDRNGWRAAEGEWREQEFGFTKRETDNGDRSYRFDGRLTSQAVEFTVEMADIWKVVRHYKFVNSRTGKTFYLYGTQNAPESKSGYSTFVSRAEAIYVNWLGAAGYSDYRGLPFEMDLTDSDLVRAIKFNPNPRLIRWAAARNPSPVVIKALRPELLKMFPGYEDVPVEWLLKMVD